MRRTKALRNGTHKPQTHLGKPITKFQYSHRPIRRADMCVLRHIKRKHNTFFTLWGVAALVRASKFLHRKMLTTETTTTCYILEHIFCICDALTGPIREFPFIYINWQWRSAIFFRSKHKCHLRINTLLVLLNIFPFKKIEREI